jgi:hypothetical protein
VNVVNLGRERSIEPVERVNGLPAGNGAPKVVTFQLHWP